MGQIRFVAHPAHLLQDYADLDEAYVTGPDQVPWSRQIRIEQGQIVCQHELDQSSALFLPWPVEGFGRPILGTTTLMERDEPYQLQVELARGKINQVRNQLLDWSAVGLTVDEPTQQLVSRAQRRFLSAVASQDDPATAASEAEQALVHAVQAAEQIAATFVQRALANRHRQEPQIPTLLCCSLLEPPPNGGLSDSYLEAFSGAALPFNWREIEPAEGEYHWESCDSLVNWCLENRLEARGGPLVQLAPRSLPDWLWLWERDYPNLVHFMSDFIETTISRYKDKVRVWEVTGRANSAEILSLNEEQLLRLTVKALEVARQADPNAQYVIRIDQPWGQYLARGRRQLSPLHYADTLLRAELGIAEIDLEIGMGYLPGGTPRDLMELSRLLDLWSLLGAPLGLTLAFPSASGPDAQASHEATCATDAWRMPWSEKAQAEWARQCVCLALAKPNVRFVAWTYFSDAQKHEWPHAGLVRPDGTAKAALGELTRIRSQYLR